MLTVEEYEQRSQAIQRMVRAVEDAEADQDQDWDDWVSATGRVIRKRAGLLAHALAELAMPFEGDTKQAYSADNVFSALGRYTFKPDTDYQDVKHLLNLRYEVGKLVQASQEAARQALEDAAPDTEAEAEETGLAGTGFKVPAVLRPGYNGEAGTQAGQE